MRLQKKIILSKASHILNGEGTIFCTQIDDNIYHKKLKKKEFKSQRKPSKVHYYLALHNRESIKSQ
jgi:hypothetical protein